MLRFSVSIPSRSRREYDSPTLRCGICSRTVFQPFFVKSSTEQRCDNRMVVLYCHRKLFFPDDGPSNSLWGVIMHQNRADGWNRMILAPNSSVHNYPPSVCDFPPPVVFPAVLAPIIVVLQRARVHYKSTIFTVFTATPMSTC